jgi:iron complex outermembrane receptor protein
VLLLNAGAMIENNNVSGTEVLPRVMLNWLAAPEHTFRAGVSRAHRPASIFERAADQRIVVPGVGLVQNWLGYAGIRPEELQSTEVGYYGDWRALRATVDVRAFDERIRNFMEIIGRPVPPGNGAFNPVANSFANARELNLRGVEYQAAWRPTATTQLMAGQSFVNPDFAIDGQFLSVPRVTGSLAWLQRLPDRWDATLTWSHVGAMTWSGPGGMLPSHDRVDFRLAKAFRLNGARAEAALVAQNLGGAYPEFQPGFAFGRVVFGSLRLLID